MIWSQALVLLWIQFVVAAALLLGAARVALRWVRQPVERIRLVQFAVVAVFAAPALMLLAPWPTWQLGLVPTVPVPAHKATLAAHPQSVPAIEVPAVSSQPIAARDDLDEIGVVPVGGRRAALLHGRQQRPLDVGADEIGSASALPAPVPVSPAAASEPRSNGWFIAASLLISANVVVLLHFLIERGLGALQLRRLVRDASPAGIAVCAVWNRITGRRGEHVRVVVSPAIDTPLMFGWKRPVVLVPADLAAAGGPALEFCLTHEWSHIERQDILLWNGLWAAQCFLWQQPSFWALRRELRVCQDMLADDRSTRAGLDAIEYSELLLAFSRKQNAAPLAGALTFFDHPSQLTRRVKLLLLRPILLRPRCTWRFSLAIALSAAVSAGLISAVRLDSASAVGAETSIEASRDGETRPKVDGPPAAVPVDTTATLVLLADTAQATEKPAPEKPAVPPQEPASALTYNCQVVDKETGKGIPGARVVVHRSSLTSQQERFIADSTHTTDADGKYVVDIPAEQVADRYLYIRLDVEHDGYAARKGWGYALSMIRKNETLGERPFFEKTELYPADPVTGLVISPDGTPLAGVKVRCYSMADRGDVESHSFNDTSTTADGKFRINLHKDADGVLWIIPKDFAIVEKFIAKKRGDLGEFRLAPGVRVSGRVLGADGQPLAGVAVNIDYAGDRDLGGLPVASSVERGAISGADGQFAFNPLPAGDYYLTPSEHRSDPLERDRTVYPVPGVFVRKKVALKAGGEMPPIEVQAVPHVVIHAQILDSKGQKTRGHAFHVYGQLDGVWWNSEGRPDTQGTIVVRVPHGLQKTRVDLMTNEHGALRYRMGKGQPLQDERRQIDLGTLNADVDDFEIIRYRAPIVIVSAVDESGQPLKDFKTTATYPWGKQEYILKGEERSDISFEYQTDGRHRTSQMLPDEEVTFTVKAAGYENATEKVTLPEGETKELTVTLKKQTEQRE